MHRILLATILLIVMANSALADNTTYNWDGFYAGVLGSRFDSDYFISKSPQTPMGLDGYELTTTVGFGTQQGPLVIGAALLGGYRGYSVPGGNAEIDHLFLDARAEVGYPIGQFMPYVFAGGGVANARLTISIGVPVTGYRTEWHNHYSLFAGAGFEAAISDNLRFRSEYQFSNYSLEQYQVAGTPVSYAISVHAFRAGLIYRFD